MTNFELLGQPMAEPAAKKPRSEADKWWDGLPEINPVNSAPARLLGPVWVASDTIPKLAFNEGLKWSEGFGEWWNTLPITSLDLSFRSLGGYVYHKETAKLFWLSIHTHKAKQASQA